MKKKMLTGVAAAALVVTGTMVPAEAAAPTFTSCAALYKVWPKGVAKSDRAALRAAADGHYRAASGPRAVAVYLANASRLDRDKDGVACEVTR